MSKLTALISVLVLLGLVACEKPDPRFPVYFRYKLEVKVDGTPVTLDRVIKCTGTIVEGLDWLENGVRGWIHSNPPVIGASVPESSAAVYAQVPGACQWAAGFGGRHFKKPPIKPGDMARIIWVKDTSSFSDIEYYVSKSSLSARQGHVEFVKLYPLEIVSEADFYVSENLAGRFMPNLRPFVRSTEKLRKKMPEWSSWKRWTKCNFAWVIDRQEWSTVPGLVGWTDNLPKDKLARRLPEKFWKSFDEKIPVRSGTDIARHNRPSEKLSKNERKKGGRFATLDEIHPVVFSSEGPYVDFTKRGIAGCLDAGQYKDREIHKQPGFSAKFSQDRDVGPYENSDTKLQISVTRRNPFYVRELDSFVIFDYVFPPQGEISEPLELGPDD